MPPLSLADNEHVYMDLAQKLYKYCPKEWKKEASKVSGEVLHGEMTAVRPPLSPSQVTSRTRECCQGVGGHLVSAGLGGGGAKSQPWGCHSECHHVSQLGVHPPRSVPGAQIFFFFSLCCFFSSLILQQNF